MIYIAYPSFMESVRVLHPDLLCSQRQQVLDDLNGRIWRDRERLTIATFGIYCCSEYGVNDSVRERCFKAWQRLHKRGKLLVRPEWLNDQFHLGIRKLLVWEYPEEGYGERFGLVYSPFKPNTRRIHDGRSLRKHVQGRH